MSASAEGCKQPRCLPSLLASRNNDPFLLQKVERIAHDAHKYMQSLLNAPLQNCTKKGVSLWALRVNSLPALVLREDVQMNLK